jgi:ATP-binding cassette subfamily G (WHITE) protein 1
MYYGPAEDSIAYFAREGYACPQYSNPADYFFMDILNTTNLRQGKSARYSAEERIPKLLAVWKKSHENEIVLKSINQPERTTGVSNRAFKFISGFTVQFPILYFRAARNAFRNKLVVKAKLGQALFLAILMGLIYLDIPSRGLSAQVQDRGGVLFFLAINQVRIYLGVLVDLSS